METKEKTDILDGWPYQIDFEKKYIKGWGPKFEGRLKQSLVDGKF